MSNQYRELQKRLDLYSFGFPETDSGLEIELLKELFTEKDITVFLAMSPRLETPAEAAPRLGMSEAEAEAVLEDMAARGLLFRLRRDARARYGAIPFMHGLVEFHINKLDPKFAALLKSFYERHYNRNISDNADLFLRVVPVNREVTFERHVASYEDAKLILDNAGTIALAECTCRKQMKLMGKGCDAPLEACFMFGSMAEYYIDNGIGKRIDAGEALRIVRECQEAGLVTQPATSQNPSGMCNCCGDCCGVLGAIKANPKPAGHVFSNHFAEVNGGECTGCALCEERCPMEAIAMSSADIAEVDLDRCIGCGLCAMKCPAGAILLREKSPENRRPVPADTREQMTLMAKKRGLI